jgi:hypothetical protein
VSQGENNKNLCVCSVLCCGSMSTTSFFRLITTSSTHAPLSPRLQQLPAPPHLLPSGTSSTTTTTTTTTAAVPGPHDPSTAAPTGSSSGSSSGGEASHPLLDKMGALLEAHIVALGEELQLDR